jgi:GT2 family glycosyltransferase
MNRPHVYIIILNYKRWGDTQECLESVFRSSYPNFSVIVIDNDSQNDSIAHLTEWATCSLVASVPHVVLHSHDISKLDNPSSLPRLTFIQNEKNTGFAAGNNVALRLLATEDAYFWLLNPDITIVENTLEELVAFVAGLSPDAIIGGVIKALAGNHEILFYGGATMNLMTSTITPITKPGADAKPDYIHGACFFSHASNLEKVGLLPEHYFLYWEESDWCYRARQLGCQLYVCPTAICYDKISTTIGRGYLADYYYVRNGLLFISTYRRGNLPVVVFFNGLRFLKRLLTGKWEKARGVLRGTIDFLKMKRA